MPQSNPNCDAGQSNTNGYTYCYNSAGKSDADGYGNDASSIPHAHGDCDSDKHAKAYADTKTAAHATSSADAAVRAHKE